MPVSCGAATCSSSSLLSFPYACLSTPWTILVPQKSPHPVISVTLLLFFQPNSMFSDYLYHALALHAPQDQLGRPPVHAEDRAYPLVDIREANYLLRHLGL